MKFIYITLLILLLSSCGNTVKEEEKINTRVSTPSENGGGFGTPLEESGTR